MDRQGEPRPLALLRDYSRRYPRAWKTAANMRRDRGKDLPDWPEWCYLPLSGAFAIVDAARPITDGEELDFTALQDVAAVAALSAWRMTKGVYRFDETIFRKVSDTPLSGDLPADALFRLPEWCCYVETPGEHHRGFFVHLEYDPRGKRSELRFVLDFDDALLPVVAHLGKPTLKECVEAAIEESWGVLGAASREPVDSFSADEASSKLAKAIEPLVSLTLYLCSASAEIASLDGDPDVRPQNPAPKKTRRGPKEFAADNPTEWAVGWRLGAALGRAESLSKERGHTDYDGENARQSPRAHVRRAHWHTFWRGRQSHPEQRERLVKWLPPIPVNVNDEELPAVIRRVN